jgi:cytochrome c oxidase cbb3-type subunit III
MAMSTEIFSSPLNPIRRSQRTSSLRSTLRGNLLVALLASLVTARAQSPVQSTPAPATQVTKSSSPELVESGRILFRQDCSFCHGREAGGGEGGPDLTRSKLVTQDVGGDKIGPTVRNGRADKGMPSFNLSDQPLAALTAFIHAQQDIASSNKGGRKGVDAADLQTGNAEAGKRYFQGAGGCAACHSPTGDLAGIASRLKGLELEQQMLYPKPAKSKATVILASGKTIAGTLQYLDEFTIGITDPEGSYRSWRTADVQYEVDPALNAHVELLSKYTDANIHDLMAYLQTLR